ncbi:DUF1705 domain-containing protein, partial [Klebsiella quasipneumoniae]|nr:DUF1705 domain-containing protein [Klebsiella quasipneumoniae]
VEFSVMNLLTTLGSLLKLDRMVISLFIPLSASAHYFIWSFGVVISPRAITTPKPHMKYCPAALTRIKRLSTTRSSSRN